ncbi:UNVERIFIED_CONTAM: hypothetical protein K2H54_002154 [Gekko kuhli]
MRKDEIGHMLHHVNIGLKVKQCVHQIPSITMEATVQPITRTVLRDSAPEGWKSLPPMSQTPSPTYPPSAELGTESSNGSTMAREEQDGGGGGAEEQRSCQAVPHPRSENEEGPRDAPKGPEPAVVELARLETRKIGATEKGTPAPRACTIGAWLVDAVSAWFPLKGGGAGGQNGSRGVEGVIKGRSWEAAEEDDCWAGWGR